MLILTRKTNQSIIIDGNIRITVSSIRGGSVRIGIEAPGQVPIFREELLGAGEEAPATGALRGPRAGKLERSRT